MTHIKCNTAPVTQSCAGTHMYHVKCKPMFQRRIPIHC